MDDEQFKRRVLGELSYIKGVLIGAFIVFILWANYFR